MAYYSQKKNKLDKITFKFTYFIQHVNSSNKYRITNMYKLLLKSRLKSTGESEE